MASAMALLEQHLELQLEIEVHRSRYGVMGPSGPTGLMVSSVWKHELTSQVVDRSNGRGRTFLKGDEKINESVAPLTSCL